MQSQPVEPARIMPERLTPRFCKPNLDETIGRLKDFWLRRMRRHIMAVVRGFPNPHFEGYLRRHRFEPEGAPARDIPDEEAQWEHWDAKCRIFQEIEDDSLPVIYPTLDFGESLMMALVGGQIEFFWRGDGSTYSAPLGPLVKGEEDLDALRFDEDGYWARRVKQVTIAAQDRARGRYGICPFITMDALNFAGEVMGTTRAYTEVAYGGSREIHWIMDFAVDLNIRFLEMQQKLIDNFVGGAFHWQAYWVPFEGATPWLSVDSYTCCSPRTYAEAGLAYQQRLIDHFGQGVMHFHTSRIDLLLEVARLKNLLGLSIDGSGRPQDPRPFEVLLQHHREIRQVAGDLPLMCSCRKEEFLRHISDCTLPGNVCYRIEDVESIEEANSLMEQVKAYRAPD